jgi:hypothetical protein
VISFIIWENYSLSQEVTQSVGITFNKVEVTSLNLPPTSCMDMSKKKKNIFFFFSFRISKFQCLFCKRVGVSLDIIHHNFPKKLTS